MGETTEMRRSSREPAFLQRRLQEWLQARLGPHAGAEVLDVASSATNGLSSDTVLFTARWDEGDGPRTESLVARIAPDESDVPVFPDYDLERQARLLREVAARSDVPVPPVFWSEPDSRHVGSPFFVMGRVEGVVPPDVMPYTFGDNWLHDADPADRQRLQRSTVRTIAALHRVPLDSGAFAFLEFDEPGATPLRRHVAHTRRWYEFVAHDAGPSPLIERAFAWLDEHWPTAESDAVVSWGDARIGNVLYRDFEPSAVLDWEMAGTGPPELDVGWLVYSHACFNDLAATLGLDGMPDFLCADDVAAEYERANGYALRDLDWYGVYAALQWAVVFVRTGTRSVHFGERDAPARVDDFVMNAEPIERMLAGEYWS